MSHAVSAPRTATVSIPLALMMAFWWWGTSPEEDVGVLPAPPAASLCERVDAAAASVEGAPYQWGGAGPSRFDCSGLVHWISIQVGRPRPRTTSAKLWVLARGEPVHWSAGECGQLTWWTLTGDRPYGHVGVLVPDGEFVQAGTSTGVKRQPWRRGGYWDRHFEGVKYAL